MFRSQQKQISSMQVDRRKALTALAAAPLAAGLAFREPAWSNEPAGALPPVRAITHGPKYHWFGYYDKLEFDPAGRYALSNEVDFEHRSPRADDVINVGMVDLQDNDRWIELGHSRAWNWQQGCMLQWLPGSQAEVLWNDRREDRFVCHILNTESGRRRTVPHAVYCVSPDGRWALSTDFRRLNDCRPGYGYAGIADPHAETQAPDETGIWKIDLKTGDAQLIVSLAQAANIAYAPGFSHGAKHWFNHLLISPDGRRFIFLHRWRGEKEGRGFGTRMFTADADGSNLFVLDPHGKTSHFIWGDPRHVLAWAWHPSHGNAFYLYQDETRNVEIVGQGVMTVNGHCTYLPGNKWILNDTYPDSRRLQHPYLFHVASGRRVPLGHFYSPPEYTGEWRCDTHPRSSPDGTKVVIDSPHGGNGRQMYLIDIREIVKR